MTSPLESLLNTTTPRCLSGVTASRAASPVDASCVVSVFDLASEDGSHDLAEVLGYPLADYNPNCANDPDFVGPLALRWPDGKASTIFDSDIHGYHGEMDSSVKICGDGDPQVFACVDCGNRTFKCQAIFDYWDACDDLLDDEPELPVQDYFCNILVRGLCSKCGSVNDILNMDL